MATNPRVKLTDAAIADIKKADKATLIKSKGSYTIRLCNDAKCIPLLDRRDNPVIYTSKDNAKRALNRHNPKIKVEIQSRFDD